MVGILRSKWRHEDDNVCVRDTPEAIKMAPLVKAFQEKKDDFKSIVCVTVPHREMPNQVLDVFGIKPDFDWNHASGQDLYEVTFRVLTGMRDVFEVCLPDYLFVHGDTTTGMAAALAAPFIGKSRCAMWRPDCALTTYTARVRRK